MKKVTSRGRVKRLFAVWLRFSRWRYGHLFPRILSYGVIWAYLFIIFLLDIEVWPGYNLPIFYAIPVLVVAMFEPPRYVATIGVLTISLQILGLMYEHPTTDVWPFTMLGVVVVCIIAVWLAEQRQPARRREQALVRTQMTNRALRHRLLVLLGYMHLLELAPTLSPQLQEEIIGRVGTETRELKSILEELDDKTDPEIGSGF